MKIRWEWICFIASVVLAAVIGGQISVLTMPVQPGEFMDALVGGELADLAHALAALPLVVALAVVLFQRRVIPMPLPKMTLAFWAFFAILFASTTVSKFRYESMSSWFDWALYGIGFFGAVTMLGRDRGPRLLLQAAVAAGAIVALKGISEYSGMRAIDPSWRIFADWNNANALAGLFILLVFPAFGLMLSGERVEKLLSGLAAGLMLFALALTQSKGGFLAFGVGLIAFLILLAFWGGWKKAGLVLLPLVFAGLLVFGVQKSAPTGSPLTRVTNQGDTAEQSGGFRKLLWLSSVDLIKESPIGTGLNTFQFESTRPGRATATNMAHNSFLQLAVEASVLALLTLVVGLIFWLRETLRGAKKLPEPRNLLRAGVIAAITAACAHSMIDSDLYYFGTGFLFFVLLGVGLVLSNDGTTPELAPGFMRNALGSLTALCGLAALALGWHEAQKSLILGRIQSPGALEELKRMSSFGDGELEYLRGLWSARLRQPDPSHFERAAQLAPSTRHLRAWSRIQAERGQIPAAMSTLDQALARDPNGLSLLLVKLSLAIDIDDKALAKETAQRMIDVEKTTMYQIRSLPELIPTETASARVFLADQAPDRKAKAELLQAALDIYTSYRKTTVPRVLQATKAGLTSGFAGETQQDVQAKMQEGQEVARRLAELYRELDAPTRASEAEAAGRELAIEVSSTSAP